MSAFLFAEIRVGSRVTIRMPLRGRDTVAQERTGRAVMRGPYGWVLNMGGAHGTPGIATSENVARVLAPKGSAHSDWRGTRSGYSIKLTGDPKMAGEYGSHSTIKAARVHAKHFAKHTPPHVTVRIVTFDMKKKPDGEVVIVETVKEGRRERF
jgi:hypothetical protein